MNAYISLFCLLIGLFIYFLNKNKKTYIEDGVLSTFYKGNNNKEFRLQKNNNILELADMVKLKTGKDYKSLIVSLFQGEIPPSTDVRVDMLIYNFNIKSPIYSNMKNKDIHKKILKYYAIKNWLFTGNENSFPSIVSTLRYMDYENPVVCKEIIDKEILLLSY